MDPNASRVRDLIHFFSDTSRSSLQELRERERNEILSSIRPEDHPSQFSRENLSLPYDQNSTAIPPSVPLVKLALVTGPPQVFEINSSLESLSLFVANTMVLAMSLFLRFSGDSFYPIIATISPQNLPFASQLVESSNLPSHFPFNLPMYSSLRLLF